MGEIRVLPHVGNLLSSAVPVVHPYCVITMQSGRNQSIVLPHVGNLLSSAIPVVSLFDVSVCFIVFVYLSFTFHLYLKSLQGDLGEKVLNRWNT